jgi:hypothetical protein
MSFLFYILLSIVVAPVLPHQGLLVRPSAFTPQLQAVWFAVNGMFLMAISVPFFVGVAAHVLDLKPGIGSLNLVKATRFALANSSYFIYWGLTWITWTLIAALRLLLLRALSIPLFPPRTNPTWTLIEIAVYVAALFPMAQFIGLWARRAMPPGSRSASAVTAADHAGGSRGLDVEQADQLDSGHWR